MKAKKKQCSYAAGYLMKSIIHSQSTKRSVCTRTLQRYHVWRRKRIPAIKKRPLRPPCRPHRTVHLTRRRACQVPRSRAPGGTAVVRHAHAEGYFSQDYDTAQVPKPHFRPGGIASHSRRSYPATTLVVTKKVVGCWRISIDSRFFFLELMKTQSSTAIT